MTTPITGPDQTARAKAIIEPWLGLDPEAQNEHLARLIAAAIHDCPGSALERFAVSGDLDPEPALHELNNVRVPLAREAWVDALGRYIISRGRRS